MNMIKAITNIIIEILDQNKLNYLHNLTGQRIFEHALVGVADGFDPLFSQYKNDEIIGPYHLTPDEILSSINSNIKYKPEKGISVICWALPFERNIKKANAKKEVLPSIRWGHGYIQGEELNDLIRKTIQDHFLDLGILACAPVISKLWRRIEDLPDGHTSNWSERHALYAAGMGTFSINNGFITERGIAHRCGSVVVNTKLEITERTHANHMENCLFMVDGSCGKCMDRCPAYAITSKGHDKIACRAYRDKLFGEFLRDGAGLDIQPDYCGLCQCGVPCESKNPVRKKSGDKVD